ncbi:unnamed protein product [Leptidea sinapis]|uniref:Uncharacterized protein n=1 Tax=Leptidea sinapis TaxID=189913 RepID=A0A5E4QMQ8_9NEOP|nr:unnamed protein product [Leptidea sinapis]
MNERNYEELVTRCLGFGPEETTISLSTRGRSRSSSSSSRRTRPTSRSHNEGRRFTSPQSAVRSNDIVVR